MRFVPLELQGAYVVEPVPRVDERGSFARLWCRDEFAEHALTADLAQCSVSRNVRTGTLRGLHFQRAPHEEAKLVRCITGAVFDAIVDLRAGSATLYSWVGVGLPRRERSGSLRSRGIWAWIPDVDRRRRGSGPPRHPHVPAAASGVRWDDPALGIEWPMAAERTISPPRPRLVRFADARPSLDLSHRSLRPSFQPKTCATART